MRENGLMSINPDPQTPIRENTELILIGTYEGERKFLLWQNQD
jgi:K+/H+ antiporter YhaU regulatory subunit KhtT